MMRISWLLVSAFVIAAAAAATSTAVAKDDDWKRAYDLLGGVPLGGPLPPAKPSEAPTKTDPKPARDPFDGVQVLGGPPPLKPSEAPTKTDPKPLPSETSAAHDAWLCQQSKDITACDRAIAAGRFTGEDLAFIYSARARAGLEKGKLDQALSDMTKAIQLLADDPHGNLPSTLAVRAKIYFELQKYDLAIADLNKSIHVDLDDPDAYLVRARAKWASGDLAGARLDYKAIKDAYRANSSDPEYRKIAQEIANRLEARFEAATPAQSPAASGRRLAFVVGINDYPNLGEGLTTPLNDADTIASTLTSIGFDVTPARNVGYAEFSSKFEEFRRKIAVGDTVFFYFAGHGVALHGANYLLPKDVPALGPDSEPLLRRQSINEVDVIVDMQDRGAKFIIVVLDACRNNPFEERAKKLAQLTGRSFTRSPDLTTSGLAPPPSGALSIYSAGIGQKALDRLGEADHSPNSVFARVFAAKLKQPNLSLVDLFFDLQDQVITLAQSFKDEDGSPHKQGPAIYTDVPDARKIYLGNVRTAQ
jgi:hypothetical protein